MLHTLEQRARMRTDTSMVLSLLPPASATSSSPSAVSHARPDGATSVALLPKPSESAELP